MARSSRQFINSIFSAVVVLIFAAAAAGQAAQPNFDRQSNFDVQHYVLKVSFEPKKKLVIGDTTVRFRPLKDEFREITLDSVGIRYRKVTLEKGGKGLNFRTTADSVIVTLDKAYKAGDDIGIRFEYTTTPKKGVYFVPEQKKGNKVVRSAQIWTQGEPDEARHWFPSFDFPSDKATTEQYITVPEKETVVGNGTLLGKKKNANGSVTHHYRMDIPFSTYLVSFVVGKYVAIEEKFKDIPLTYYVYPGRESLVPAAYGKTKDILSVFEDITKFPYPYQKYDQTMVSSFTFGGMENITATTMADTEIFFAETPYGKSAVEDLVSHELAHSWFGNLVTCRNWAELWLNEGFATYFEAVSREKLYGRKAYMFKVIADAEIFLADDVVNPKRVALYNLTAGNLKTLFDRSAVTYNKGGVVLHMLREQIGDDAFWTAVNDYLNKHKFSTAATGDLKAAMEKASGQELGWFFDQWVYGAGSPRLEIKQVYNAAAGTLEISVSQTQKSGTLTPSAYRLPLEVEVKTASGVITEKLDIRQRTQRFDIKVDSRPEDLVIDKEMKVPLKIVKLANLADAK